MSGRHLTIFAIALLGMSGCGEDKAAGDKAAADVKAAAATPAAPKPQAKGKAPAKAQTEEDPAPVLSVPEGFRYASDSNTHWLTAEDLYALVEGSSPSLVFSTEIRSRATA